MELQELRRVLGHFVTGVTVVTTMDKVGTPFGLTVNAFTSLSLNPPLVLICIDKEAQCYRCFDQSRIFAVNVLSEDQEAISRRFASRGIEKFAGIKWHRGKLGVALLDGAMGHIECKVVHSYEGGDHTIYVGEIVNTAASGKRPLIFFKGKYHRLPHQEL